MACTHSHDNMLGNRDNVGSGHFCHQDLALIGRIQVDVIGTDTGRDTGFEVLSFGNDFGSSIARVEGSGDENVGVDDLLLESGFRALLCAQSEKMYGQWRRVASSIDVKI